MADKTRWWQSLGNVSQMVAAIGAFGALFFVAWQVSQIEVNSRKANARQVYLAYSEAGMRYPEFQRPQNYAAIRQDAVKFEQYKWYVTQMIMAYDEMIDVSQDQNWIKGFDYELPDHVALLCDLKASEPRFFTQFEDDTNALVDNALRGKCG